MNEISIFLVGLVIGIIVGIFIACIMSASSMTRSINDINEEYEIKRITRRAYHDGLLYDNTDTIEIADRLSDCRYIIRVKPRK